MSVASQFFGGNKPPITVVNGTSTNGSAPDFVPGAPVTFSGAKRAASGALTANTLTTVLSLTGKGSLSFFGCAGIDATAREHRIKLTVDGVVVFDGKTVSTAAINSGILLVGSLCNFGAVYVAIPDSLYFSSSLLIEYASSVSETAKTNFYYQYRMY